MTSQRNAQLLPPGEKVCIIGAGSSGLTAAKALKDRGIPYDQFEMGSDIGGLWRYENDNGRSAAYKTLHIITSKWNMEFADYPIPEDFPDFGHHSDVLQYFEDYAAEFELKDGITFNTEVVTVTPEEDNRWSVTLDTGEHRRYGAVLVCSGHHWNPRWPDFPGPFEGGILHSHDYCRPEDFSGQRVLVVGMGNSGCDIAVDLSRVADAVHLSTRSSAWVIPKYLLGLPTDQWTGYYMEYFPVWVRRLLLRVLVWLSVGNQERYGVPVPNRRMLQEHPTLNQELLPYVGHGRIEIKPNIERLDGTHVCFEDGTREAYDQIIYATGYGITFPFLPDDVFTVENNRVELYRYVVAPTLPGLYFIGLLQPLGAIMPLAERQSKWVAALLDGAVALPNEKAMRRSIEETRAEIERRYHSSPRHTIEVDFWDYIHQMEREMREGRKRARRWGVPSRAETAPRSDETVQRTA